VHDIYSHTQVTCAILNNIDKPTFPHKWLTAYRDPREICKISNTAVNEQAFFCAV